MEKSALMPILEQIERDKGIKKEEILRMIESSLVSAYRKQYGKNYNVVAALDPETAEIKAYLVKRVVEKVENPVEEISLEEIKELSVEASVGDEIHIPVETEEFSRIAAQIAKQIIIQKIREVERSTLFEEFSSKEKQLASATVFRFAERNMILDLGRTEALLPMSEQVRRERFNVGDRMKVLVVKVEKTNRGPQIIASRAHPDFVKRLIEMEVPEVADKIVEIIHVVRDPGFRSKVAVRSSNPKIDPVGTCVGVRGARIRPVIDELRGERIDLIPWSDDSEKFIAAALSPAKALSIHMSREAKTCEVLVSNDMYSLAVGRNGQNVRLASQLTGWHIDVKSEMQKREESARNVEAAQKELSDIGGIGPKIMEVLIKSGINTAQKLADASADQLTSLQGVGDKTAEKLIDAAKNYLLNAQNPSSESSAQEGEVISSEQEERQTGRVEGSPEGSQEETA